MWKNFCSAVDKMFDFSGRENRSVFWSTVAFSLIILSVVAGVIGITEWMQSLFHKTFTIGSTHLVIWEQGFFALVCLLLFYPLVSCGVRRLHDINASGILLIVPLVNIILLCLPSTENDVEPSSGARYTIGEFFVLLFSIVVSGFCAVILVGKINGSIPIFGQSKNADDFEMVVENQEDKIDNKKSADIDSKNKSKNDSKILETDGENPVFIEESKSNLLDAGAVIIPILDRRKFNYIKTGEENLPDGSVATQYKHVQTLTIDFLGNTNIYDNFDSPTVIGTVMLGDQYTVLNLIQITNPQLNDNIGQFWLEVAYGKGSGFVNAGRIDNPYRNDNYVPLEQIQIGEKLWTVRRFDSLFSFYHSIDIRDYPGTEGTNVIGKIEGSLSNVKTVTSDAITEQDDTSETAMSGEPWIRVEYEGIVGWIPGAYTEIQLGSVKYQTPDGILANDLGVGI